MDMAVQALTTKAEQGFAGHYEAAKSALPGAGSPWVGELRDQAMRDYAARGLPSRRVEEWKYTDLRAQLAEAYPPAPLIAGAVSAEDVDKTLGPALAAIDGHRLVVVDGRFRAELSDIEALEGFGEVVSLAEALAAPPEWFRPVFGKVNPPDIDPLVALNTALMSGGVVLRIEKGARVEKPVHLIHVHAAKQPACLAARNFITVGEGASLTVMESYVSVSDAPVQRLPVSEIVIGDGAQVQHLKVQAEGAAATHLATWMARIGAGARYDVLQLSTGAALARDQLFVRFAGEGASARINAAALGRGRQHHDTTLVVDHAVPACESRELFKAVLDDSARGIFQGKVIVQPGAQKTDGKQMAQALLLSEEAEFDSKPELEIFADDVACGHGSTSGQIDDDLLFYLRARGIPEDQARVLLILAFMGEALDLVADEPLREALMGAVEHWLEEGRA